MVLKSYHFLLEINFDAIRDFDFVYNYICWRIFKWTCRESLWGIASVDRYFRFSERNKESNTILSCDFMTVYFEQKDKHFITLRVAIVVLKYIFLWKVNLFMAKNYKLILGDNGVKMGLLSLAESRFGQLIFVLYQVRHDIGSRELWLDQPLLNPSSELLHFF